MTSKEWPIGEGVVPRQGVGCEVLLRRGGGGGGGWDDTLGDDILSSTLCLPSQRDFC